ncbi:MAG: class I SAM-dependent methyltransferase [Euryarchaeota archaeon]|nr:class I SAM-dependent methyltransferase [Euryarchaeota archaeon]
MSGIINWNELWKVMRSSSAWRRVPETDTGFWDKYAEQCNESAMQNRERTARELSTIGLDSDCSVLDVGSGVGRLAIPIARRVATVTAIDPSLGMLRCLKERMKKDGVNNIVCINKRWEDIELGVDTEPHDIVIASYSLGMFDMQEALAKIDAAAKRSVYLFEFVGGWMDEKLWKKLYGEKHPAWTGYIYLYNILHEMGIYADVQIIDSGYYQRYESLADAVDKWMELYNLPPDKAGVVKEHLSNLASEEDDGTLSLKRKTKSAVIWWMKDCEAEGVKAMYDG